MIYIIFTLNIIHSILYFILHLYIAYTTMVCIHISVSIYIYSPKRFIINIIIIYILNTNIYVNSLINNKIKIIITLN